MQQYMQHDSRHNSTRVQVRSVALCYVHPNTEIAAMATRPANAAICVTHAPRHLRMLRSAWHELNMNLITATCLAWRHAITLLVRAPALAL